MWINLAKEQRQGFELHRRPIQKRQGLTEWTGRWSHGDRTLGSYVRSVAAERVQASVFDRTLALKVTRRWLGVSGQADVR